MTINDYNHLNIYIVFLLNFLQLWRNYLNMLAFLNKIIKIYLIPDVILRTRTWLGETRPYGVPS